jgi:sialic acid synthase SpsE
MKQTINVSHNTISSNKTFVIAEIAGSHSGDLEKMKKLINAASRSGADAVKLQKFKAEDLVVDDYEYFDILRNLEINDNLWPEIISFAKEVNIPILVDIFNSEDAKILSELGVSGFKIHTTDINNLELINQVASFNLPIFLAVGASTLEEIEKAINVILNSQDNLILMYGFQSYPTPVEEANLKFINILKESFGLNVGFLDHTDGGSVESMVIPILSLTFGASVIEKHITINRAFKDTDYQSALNPEEFKHFVDTLRKVEKSIVYSSFDLSEKEINYANTVKKRIVAKNNMKSGKKIEKSDLSFKRASNGLFLDNLEMVLGMKTKKSLKKDEPITIEVFK